MTVVLPVHALPDVGVADDEDGWLLVVVADPEDENRRIYAWNQIALRAGSVILLENDELPNETNSTADYIHGALGQQCLLRDSFKLEGPATENFFDDLEVAREALGAEYVVLVTFLGHEQQIIEGFDVMSEIGFVAEPGSVFQLNLTDRSVRQIG